MAVRNESVRLSLDDQFSSGMARAAASTALFKKELDGLDGKRVSRELDDTARSTDRVGTSTRRAGPEIDKFSGRLGLLVDAAITLGPALIPLSAAAIPALTGALAGMGAAAGAIGVTLLAFNGIGDALKAIDKAQLQPTVENLQAMQVALEKLGPAGAEFAQFLDGLEPQLHDLQNVARAGLFPGVEDGINQLLSRLPLVRQVVADLSSGLGDLARDAGRSLSSDAWTPFFDYVANTAGPTMDDFARATGNVALGFANLLVAFAPMTSGFTSGLVDATRAFADWSSTLDSNKSFQSFLDTVRQSGPQALDLFTALAKALVGLVKAAAPFGQVVLPALTATANLFATIANSPIGPGLYAAAAGMVAFNRAADLAGRSSARFQASWDKLGKAQVGAGVAGGLGLLALSLTDVDNKLGVANTAMGTMAGLMVGGPWGAAIGAGIGATLDFRDAQSALNDEMARTEDIVRSGTIKQQQDAYIDLKRKIDDTSFSMERFLFGTDKQEFALSELDGALKNTGGLADLFAGDIGRTAKQLSDAAAAGSDLNRELAELNGWFDKRDAIRGYQQAIKDLAKSLHDGFQPKDAATLDALGRSILQVAQNIKSPKVRGDFLAGARAQLEDMAQHAAPKAQAAVQRLIDKFDSVGLTHPSPIEITADDRRARATVDGTKTYVKSTLDFLSRQKATPAVDANDNPFVSVLNSVRSQLHALDGYTVNTYVRLNRIGGVTSSAGGHTAPGVNSADGGTVVGKRYPYGDKMLYMLAPGEEVVSNRYGQADRHRSLLKAINANRAADGATAGGGKVSRPSLSFIVHDPALAALVQGAESAAKALKIMNNQLDADEKSLQKHKSALDATNAARDSLSSSISDKFNLDLGARPTNTWAANSSGGLLSQITQATSQAQAFPAIIAALKAAGLTGPALAEVLQEMDFNQLQVLAANPSQAGQIGTALGGLYTAQQVAGTAGGQAVYGAQMAAELKELRGIQNEVRELRRDVREMDKHNQQAQKQNSKDVAAGVNGAAASGHGHGRGGPR